MRFIIFLLIGAIIVGFLYSGVWIDSFEKNIEPVIVDRITQDSSKLVVSVIDVGQGDAILIQYNNTAMMVDCGGLEKGQEVCEYLNKSGVTTLKYLVITHDHEDHTCNLNDIVLHYKIENYVDNGELDKYEVLNIISRGTNHVEWYLGDYVDFDPGVNITVLNPQNKKYSNTNDGSIVMRIVKDEVSILLTGDIERNSEMDIVRSEMDIDSDILKVAHHGSDTSSTDTFLHYVTPKTSIVSLGVGNLYGHPSKSVVKRLSEYGNIIRTDESGSVVISTDGNTYTIETTR